MYIYITVLSCSEPFNFGHTTAKSGYRAYTHGKGPAELTFIPESQLLYQPMALFPIQLLPYQYYQIIRGKFLIPSAYFLYSFFMPEYPFSEAQYTEPQFKEKVFEEKGEYSQ